MIGGYEFAIANTVLFIKSILDGCDVWYEIQSGNDVISCDSDFITAISVGTAILKAGKGDIIMGIQKITQLATNVLSKVQKMPLPKQSQKRLNN